MKTKTKMAERAEEAARLHREGSKQLRRRPVDYFEKVMNPIEGRRKVAEAEKLLTVAPEALVGDPSTEMVSAAEPDEPFSPVRDCLLDTLTEPNAISIAASEQRAAAAAQANVLAPALDAVQTVHASNSIEKMLAHQLAAVHMAGMETLARASTTTMPPLEHVRMMNAVARLFDTYASGCAVLQKLKSGGRQHVVVQYQQVNVGAGGKALVAGRVRPGSRRKGRGRQNGDTTP